MKNLDFPNSPKTFLGNLGTNFTIGKHKFDIVLYGVTKDHDLASLCKQIEGINDFPSLYNEGFNFTYEFHYIHTVFA